jgi:hypothetical protein
VPSKPKAQLAREHLDQALLGVEAEDATEAVTWLFVALEAAITALALDAGQVVEPKHWKKAELAHELFVDGRVAHDFAPTLRTLNEARKEAVYDGEDPHLGGSSLEDLAADVEAAVQLAEEGNNAA